MNSIGWKVCMFGAAGVGKTSLVLQYVERIFHQSTKPTLGIKISKKVVRHEGSEATLVLWDFAADSESVHSNDLANAARFHDQEAAGLHAYILVADVSRLATLKEAEARKQRIDRQLSQKVPFVLALNKSDLDQKEFDETEARRQIGDWQIFSTSAKTGDGVDGMFDVIAAALFKQNIRAR